MKRLAIFFTLILIILCGFTLKANATNPLIKTHPKIAQKLLDIVDELVEDLTSYIPKRWRYTGYDVTHGISFLCDLHTRITGKPYKHRFFFPQDDKYKFEWILALPFKCHQVPCLCALFYEPCYIDAFSGLFEKISEVIKVKPVLISNPFTTGIEN